MTIERSIADPIARLAAVCCTLLGVAMARADAPAVVAEALSLVAPATQPASVRADIAARRVTAEWRYVVHARPGTRRVVLTCTLPRTLADRQTLHSLSFSQPPSSCFVEAGNEYARFDLARPAETTTIVVHADLTLFRCDLATQLQHPSTQRSADFSAALRREKFIETNDADIRHAAAALPVACDVCDAAAVARYVVRSLYRSGYASADRGAAWALKHRMGDCSEYSDLFVALCRARGIPATMAEGCLITPVRAGDTAKHAWAEAYVDGVGWVPFDCFHVAGGSADIDRLAPTRIITGVRRNDPETNGYHQWSFRYWGEPATIDDAFSVLRDSPIEKRE